MKENFIKDLKDNSIDFQLKENMGKHSTMRIGNDATYFIEVKNIETLKIILKLCKTYNIPIKVIGEGSNTVFINDFKGLVLKPNLKGVEVVNENSNNTWIKVCAGENWHKFVEYTVNKNLSGMENLALIPGTVGAAPVQNIAAYGQNQVDTFEELTAIEITSGIVKVFNKEDCKYEYRSSIFKRNLKDKYIIIDVTYKLNKSFTLESNYHDRYLSLESELKELGNGPYTLKDVFKAVINLRNKKLPKIEEFGTLGSFFKNPVVSKKKFKELSAKISELQSYPVENLQYKIKDWKNVKDDYVKIPVARLLDELGWKGKWIGNMGTFKNHALCVITNGKATTKEFRAFINEMKESIKKAYEIDLEEEVNLI